MDLNRATVLGRLTRDPEARTTTTGKPVTSMSVATGRVWTDQNGVKQERTEFHDCVLWGKLAEIAAQYLSKGRRVYAEGRLETRSWDGQDGSKKYRTEIIVDNLIMLDGGSGATSGGNASYQSSSDDDSSPRNDNDEEEIKVEDIPF